MRKRIILKAYSSIPKMFESTAKENSEKVALKFFKDEEIKSITWGKYYELAQSISKSLLKLGFKKGDHIAILSETRYEWCISDMSILGIGGCTVTIFPTLGSDQVRFILNDSDSIAVFTSNQNQLDKISSINFKKDLPKLRYIFMIEENLKIPENSNLDILVKNSSKNSNKNSIKNKTQVQDSTDNEIASNLKISCLNDLIEMGRKPKIDEDETSLDKISIDENDLASIIYTSGTTGVPKGVMLSHKNFISDVVMASMALDLDKLKTQVSTTYLPLSHSFTRTVEHFGVCYFGSTLCFARNYDNLAENIHDFHPTGMIGVPYVFEQIYKMVTAEVSKMPKNMQNIFWNAVEFGKSITETFQQGKKPSFIDQMKYWIYQKFVFKKLRDKFGGKLEQFLSGSAPLNPEIARFFSAVGIKIYEGYGLTEAAPVTHTNRDSMTTNVRPSFKIGTVGPVVGWDTRGTVNPYGKEECKIAETGNVGEVLIRGANVMMGYYKRPEETKAALDEDGWLHTGDLGEIDSDGYLKIIGRVKEILVLRTGKKVAPNLVEQIYQNDPYINQIMLLGEGEKFIAAFIVPEFSKKAEITVKINENGENEIISADVINSNREFCSDPAVNKFFSDELKKIEQGKLSHYETIKKFKLIPEEFTVENKLLSPTLKIRREKAIQHYFKELQEIYSTPESSKN